VTRNYPQEYRKRKENREKASGFLREALPYLEAALTKIHESEAPHYTNGYSSLDVPICEYIALELLVQRIRRLLR
jgi:hypothetical protein